MFILPSIYYMKGELETWKTTKLFDYYHAYNCVCMQLPNEELSFLLHNKSSFNSKTKYFEMANNYFTKKTAFLAKALIIDQ